MRQRTLLSFLACLSVGVASCGIGADEAPLPQESLADPTDVSYSRFYNMRVNERADGTHTQPDVAASSDGVSVIAWTDDSGADGLTQVHMAIFDARGSIVGSEWIVNQNDKYDQWAPRLSISPSGEHIAVSFMSTHLGEDFPAQVVVSAFKRGAGPELSYERSFDDIQVSVMECIDGGTLPSCQQATHPNRHQDAAIADSGEFVVVYAEDRNGNQNGQIEGVFYETEGTLATRRALNHFASSNQDDPAVAWLDDKFAVVWQESSNHQQKIMVRTFWDLGRKASYEMRVHEAGNSQADPDISGAGQTMAITWEHKATSASPGRIAARRFNLNYLLPVGNVWLSSTAQAGDQKDPRVAMGTQQDYAVVWSDDRDDNGRWQVRASTFNAQGDSIVTDKVVNVIEHLNQHEASVALPGGKKVLTAWTDESGDWADFPSGASSEPQIHRLLTDLEMSAPAASSAAPSRGEPNRGDDYTLVVIPDTQYYTFRAGEQFSSALDGDPSFYPDTYNRQANWIARHRDEANIVGVLHMGDVTHEAGEGEESIEWETATSPMVRLRDANIPVVAVPGNHDYRQAHTAEHHGCQNFLVEEYGIASQREASAFNDFAEAHLTPFIEGTHEAGSYENTFGYFSTPGREDDLLLMNLEFAPRKDALCWAGDVIRSDENRGRRVVVTTHGHLGSADYHKSANAYQMAGRNGAEVLDELILRHSNIFLVLSGHVTAANRKVEQRLWLPESHPGRSVHQILTDYQGERAGSLNEGHYGNGWFRTLLVSPNSKTIRSEAHTVLRGDLDVFFQPEGGHSKEPVFNSLRATESGETDPTSDSHTFEFEYNPDFGPEDYAEDSCFNGGFADRTVHTTMHPSELGSHQPNLVEPDLARFSDETLMAVWEGDPDGDAATQIQTRLFDENGCEAAPLEDVNVVPNGSQRKPRIWVGGKDTFVVIWMDDGDSPTISARAGNWTGSALTWGNEVTLVTNEVDLSDDISVDGAPDGSGGGGQFTVAWRDNAGLVTFGQWDLSGTREISGSSGPATVAEGHGAQVVVNDDGLVLLGYFGSEHEIHTTLYNGSISPQPEASGEVGTPPLALWLDNGGRGLAAWTSEDGESIRGRRVDVAGSANVQLASAAGSGTGLGEPTLAGSADGSFSLVWQQVNAKVETNSDEGCSSNTALREWQDIRAAGFAPLADGATAPTLQKKPTVVSRAYQKNISIYSSPAAVLAPAEAPCACSNCPPKLFLIWEANEYGNLHPNYPEEPETLSGHGDLEAAMVIERRLIAKGMPF